MLLGGRGEMEPEKKSKKKPKKGKRKVKGTPFIAMLGKKPVSRMILVLIAS